MNTATLMKPSPSHPSRVRGLLKRCGVLKKHNQKTQTYLKLLHEYANLQKQLNPDLICFQICSRLWNVAVTLPDDFHRIDEAYAEKIVDLLTTTRKEWNGVEQQPKHAEPCAFFICMLISNLERYETMSVQTKPNTQGEITPEALQAIIDDSKVKAREILDASGPLFESMQEEGRRFWCGHT